MRAKRTDRNPGVSASRPAAYRRRSEVDFSSRSKVEVLRLFNFNFRAQKMIFMSQMKI